MIYINSLKDLYNLLNDLYEYFKQFIEKVRTYG